MRPIRDIAIIHPDSVLYHSAFGFARVRGIDVDNVELDWQRDGENLPRRISYENLRRVYALCPEDGFFHRALHDTDALQQILEVDPAGAMALLLRDLQGPQRKEDVREWLVSRQLLSERGFRGWWKRFYAVMAEDPRFHIEQDTLYLDEGGDEGPLARLRSGQLSPGRRLDLALAHRDELDPESFLEHVTLAWRMGGSQVRDLALAATRDLPIGTLIDAMMRPGPDNIEALIHLIRRGQWKATDLRPEHHQALLNRVLRGIDDGSPLDNEGRLAAALLRWACPGTIPLLARTADLPDGRRLLRATFSALPPKRAESFALDMLEEAIRKEPEGAAQWLGQEALGFGLISREDMVKQLEGERPRLAVWYRDHFEDVSGPSLHDYEEYTDDTAYTAELDLGSENTEPIPFSELPPQASGRALLGTGLAMARALTAFHKQGQLANPTELSTRLCPDGSIQIDASGDVAHSPRPLVEDPSATADVYAAAVLLLQCALRRRWPRTLPASRAVPYLRTILPTLQPSALAPLDAALHPDPRRRPKDGLTWLAQWQQAAIAEETRGYASPDNTRRIRFGLDTHVGRMKILTTQTNQDAVYAATDDSRGLLAVCDGISTANAGSGDLASGIASQIIANLWEQALPRLVNASASDLRDFLDRALRIANQAVCEAALRLAGGNLDGRVPMGTTAVVAVTQGNWINLAWLGDSRAYLVGPYGASLVTADDNQAGDRLRSWHLGFEDHWEPAGYALVGYIGHFNELQVPEPIPAHHTSFRLVPGERLVLCSDGVTDYVGDAHPEVSYVLNRAVTLEHDLDYAARRLVTLANAGGGGDNASAVIATLSD